MNPLLAPSSRLLRRVTARRASASAFFDFPALMFQRPPSMPSEEDRTRLIGEIVSLLREQGVPDDCRAAGLTLIGWLARRMPGEIPHAAGVGEMQQRQERLRTPSGQASEQGAETSIRRRRRSSG